VLWRSTETFDVLVQAFGTAGVLFLIAGVFRISFAERRPPEIALASPAALLVNAPTGSWPTPVRGRNLQFGISDGRIRANNRGVVFHP
jgi:hypothetical protein